MTLISAGELAAQAKSRVHMQCLDVRSANEFATGHIPHAMNVPLHELESRLDDISTILPLVLICKGGQRARMAAGLLALRRENITVLDGGTDAWRKAGLPLVSSKRTRWSLERQVRLAAGVLVLFGTIAAATIGDDWLLLTGFVGLGLTFAGLTDLCPMGVLLGAMPWNHARKCAQIPPTEQKMPHVTGVTSRAARR